MIDGIDHEKRRKRYTNQKQIRNQQSQLISQHPVVMTVGLMIRPKLSYLNREVRIKRIEMADQNEFQQQATQWIKTVRITYERKKQSVL